MDRPNELNLETRFDMRIPTEKDFGFSSRERHLAFELFKNQMPEMNQFMPERLRLDTLHKMRKDPMVKMGLHFIKSDIISAKYKIEGPDDREQDIAFLQWCTDQIWTRYAANALLALEFGFAGLVKRWKLEKPPEHLDIWTSSVDPVVPDDIFALPPHLIEPAFTKRGKFNGIEMRDALGSTMKTIPDEYCLWVTNERESVFGSFYGFPRIGYAYPYWRSYWFRWLLYDRHFEADADPPLVIWGPSGTYKDETGKVHHYRDDGLAIGEALRSGSTVYFPSTPYIDEQTGKPSQAKQWDMKFEYGGHNIDGFQTSFEYLDILKLRAILVPEQALVEGKNGTGARNVAATYNAAFTESQWVLMKQLDDDYNTFMLDKLAAYNFGDKPGTFKKVTESFLESNGDLMGEILKATMADPLAAGINLRKIAEKLEMPVLSEEEIEAERERKKAEFQEQMEAQTAANVAVAGAKEKASGKPAASSSNSSKSSGASAQNKPAPKK